MKRTPLKRGKGLNRGSTPLRRTPLKSNSALSRTGGGLKRSEFKAKPKQMSSEEALCRKIVKERSGGICEICAKAYASDMAHRRARSQGGPWTPSNMLHACRNCHSENHKNPTDAYAHGWHVKSTDDWLEEPVYLAQYGWVLLDDKGGFTSQ